MQEEGASEAELRENFPELYEVEVPPEVEHLQTAFIHLNLGRQQGFNGPLAISYSDLHAYCVLFEQKFTTGELELLKLMDVRFVNTIATRLNQQKG